MLHEGDGLDIAVGMLSRVKDLESLLFYVDGDHRFESVQRELEGICEACPASSIVIHDTFMQTAESNYNVGPRLAVNRFLEKHETYQVVETTTGLPGMTLLYNPNRVSARENRTSETHESIATPVLLHPSQNALREPRWTDSCCGYPPVFLFRSPWLEAMSISSGT